MHTLLVFIRIVAAGGQFRPKKAVVSGCGGSSSSGGCSTRVFVKTRLIMGQLGMERVRPALWQYASHQSFQAVFEHLLLMLWLRSRNVLRMSHAKCMQSVSGLCQEQEVLCFAL